MKGAAWDRRGNAFYEVVCQAPVILPTPGPTHPPGGEQKAPPRGLNCFIRILWTPPVLWNRTERLSPPSDQFVRSRFGCSWSGRGHCWLSVHLLSVPGRMPDHQILNTHQAPVEHFRNRPIYAASQLSARIPEAFRGLIPPFYLRRCSDGQSFWLRLGQPAPSPASSLKCRPRLRVRRVGAPSARRWSCPRVVRNVPPRPHGCAAVRAPCARTAAPAAPVHGRDEV